MPFIYDGHPARQEMPDQLLRILVVDDSRDNADIIQQYLCATRRYTVDVAYDGADALRRFRNVRPDIVLLDVMMPGVDGWEVCRQMKSDRDQAGRTRVIMVTARDDLGDKRTALETGADDFLEKPLDLSKLMAAVQRNASALANASVAESVALSGNESGARASEPALVPAHPTTPTQK